MIKSWEASEWLLLAVLVLWALRLAYKFGRETGRDEMAALVREDPQFALRSVEAERAAEGRFRRWARGRN
ncbi:hypothetical protein EGM87_16025 [Sphingobium sp. RSMS]|uniref:hypothetical protein n=1 Tax=Sphingobium sp. RSMS TaxID=520734 RepID=UPI0010F4795B|nr:hypothetical protein [Sphingobium sp. RSMS]UXC90520.1 hypothetical protein EGM87_16025 [Sphingobium sp. RSMS]